MIAEILCVGTEILLGDIVNTNAAYLAREMAAIGIDVYNQSVVGDNPARLAQSLRLAFERADIVLMTGGLGPTYDDLTKETVAQYFGMEMEMDEESKERIIRYFNSRGATPTPNNLKQAMMPGGAHIFPNNAGTAPGLAVVQEGKIAVLMPGPPFEMTAMFEGCIRQWLLQFSEKVLVSRTLHIAGMGESAVEDKLREMMVSHQNPTIAPYAKSGEVQIRITAAADNRAHALELIEPVLNEAKAVLGDVVYGVDVQNQEHALIERLLQKGMTIATAESCSGGLLSKRITDVPGASAVFHLGVCTYADEMKIKMLGVNPDTLAQHGAVSEQTAQEMAAGVRRQAGADIGIGITGVAGPGGGTQEKPVGLIYIAVDSEHYSVVEKYLPGHRGVGRDQLRFMGTQVALRLAMDAVKRG